MAGKMGDLLTKALGLSENRNAHIMTQRQLFHALLVVFSIYLCFDGFRLFISVLPKLVPAIGDSLFDFYKQGKWPLPSPSFILPLLLPSLITLALASLVFYKTNDLATWLFPEDSNSSLIIHLQTEEWLRWGLTLIGIFVIGWLAVPSLLSTIFSPAMMSFFPMIYQKKQHMEFLDTIYWEMFIGNIVRFLIQGSFGVVCLLFAPRLAAWIIRIQKHPRSSQPQ